MVSTRAVGIMSSAWQDGVTATLKGWYCNFTRPAEIDAEGVAADDLELDLVVTPAREMQLLDLSEYLALELSSAERHAVAAAYREIRQLRSRCVNVPSTNPQERHDTNERVVTAKCKVMRARSV